MTDATTNLWQRLWYTRVRDAVRGRFDASHDWRRVIAEAGLPSEAAALVDATVAATRLWSVEKVAVARELVAHFEDGVAAGQPVPALVATFGEPRDAARLIRRAKKRGRSAMWHASKWCGVALLTLVVMYALAALYFFIGRPSIRTDYLALLNRRAISVPEDQRAWPLYREALTGMGAKAEGFGNQLRPQAALTSFDIASEVTLEGESWTQTVQFLKDHETELAKLRDAAAIQELGFVLRTSPASFAREDQQLLGLSVTQQAVTVEPENLQNRLVLSTLLPHLQLLQRTANVIAADARRAAIAGDGALALANVRTILGISRHCEETPFLVAAINADEILRTAYEFVEYALKTHPDLWTDAQLRDLAHWVAAHELDWRRSFDGERAFFYDLMQRLYTDDGKGDGRLAFKGIEGKNAFEFVETISGPVPPNSPEYWWSNDGLAMLALPAANMVVASRRETLDVYDRLMSRALERIDLPLWEQKELPSSDEEVIKLLGEPLGKFRHLFIGLLMPAYDGVRIRIDASAGRRDGVLMGIAIEMYHREHDRWPESLSDLSPRWLPSLPVDRINGGPLGYRLMDGRPVVYSFGVDSDDDSGRLPKNCDGDAGKYRVSVPNDLPATTTDWARDEHDGDWAIWSTSDVNANQVGVEDDPAH